MARLTWLVARASRMTVGEIFFRMGEFVAKRWLSVRPTLRVFPSWKQPATKVDHFLTFVSLEHCAATHSQMAAQPAVYGFSWPLDQESSPQWFQFFDGTDTSNTPSFSLPYRDSDSLEADIRLAWELNRLTWLIPSAVTARGDASAAAFVERTVGSFLASDQPGKSLRWNSAIELAMQSLSLLLISELVPLNEQTDMRLAAESALANRYRWLRHWPSRFSSANNHRIAELVALIAIAERLKGEESRSDRYQRELLKELSLQTCSDGLNAERASDYHLYVLDLVETLLVLCPDMKHMSEFVAHAGKQSAATAELLSICGIWPSFGDSDEAAILGTTVAVVNRAAFLCAIGGAETHRSDLAVIKTFRETGLTAVSHPAEDGGYAYLVDHGPIGYGRIAAHAHADSLAIWLYRNGSPVLIEAGTYSYHALPKLRDELRSSSLHNTITIDGESLSKPMGPFLWNPNKAMQARLDAATLVNETATVDVVGEYQASRRHKAGIVGRTIVSSPSRLEILDRATSGDSIESHFIFSPEFRVERGGTDQSVRLRSSQGQVISVSSSGRSIIRHSVVRFSPTYGTLHEATRLSILGADTNSILFEFKSEQSQ